MSVGAWVALGIGAWAVLIAFFGLWIRRDRKRLIAELEALGLAATRLRPLWAEGSLGGVPTAVEHVNWGPHGGGRYLTRVRATSRRDLPKVVAVTPGWEWPEKAPTFGLHRLRAGQPQFDAHLELYAEDAATAERWRADLARQVVAIGTPGKRGGVCEVAVGGNVVSVCLGGTDIPIDSVRRAVSLATQLAGGSD